VVYQNHRTGSKAAFYAALEISAVDHSAAKMSAGGPTGAEF
jgi:hypothetical protein